MCVTISHSQAHITVGKERARMSRRNAPENFFPRYGVAHGCAQEPTPGSAVKFRRKSVRKNRPLVPRSNLGGKVCARTNPWFRGQTLLVPGHGGGYSG